MITIKLFKQIESNPSTKILSANLSSFYHKYKFSPKKDLGQNFLVKDSAIETLVNRANVTKKVILEIGPGTGFITKELLKKAKKVVAVEIDPKMIEVLKNEFKEDIDTEKLILINKSILDIDLERIVKEHKVEKIVSAPPYYISTDILYAIIGLKIKEAYLIFQKDFIEKIRNDVFYSPSALSVISYYYTKPEFLDDIGANSFEPIPKVNSQILKLKYRTKREFSQAKEKEFTKIIKEIFRYPNKSLRKCLTLCLKTIKDTKVQKNIQEILEEDYPVLDYKITEVSSKDYIHLFR